VLAFASVIAFCLLRLSPGDPARLVLGPQASQEAVERLRTEMGLDDSLVEQYVTYVSELIRGDLGFSWRTNVPVSTELASRLPATVELALYSMALAVLLAIPIGVFSAGGRRWIDHASRVGAIVALGTPAFWLGLMLILVFFTWLDVAPVPFGRLDDDVAAPDKITGLVTVDSILQGRPDALANGLAHLALPAITLALPLAAYLSRIVRRSVIDVYRLDFVKAARAKGAGERRILFRHALPNALLPVLTLSVLWLGDLLAGALLVEAVFNWPGIGGWVAESIVAQDFAPVQAAIILGAVTYSALNLCADVLYAYVDPRVRILRVR
jgi:peptide/nickel transport system permease protein